MKLFFIAVLSVASTYCNATLNKVHRLSISVSERVQPKNTTLKLLRTGIPSKLVRISIDPSKQSFCYSLHFSQLNLSNFTILNMTTCVIFIKVYSSNKSSILQPSVLDNLNNISACALLISLCRCSYICILRIDTSAFSDSCF